ncbi:DNA-binding transcriptional regulator [Halorhodospira sp. 9622]|uniref:helix-turn-helix domain-containing protein n=1 Tax=Halorhodospira sp. 9622 TaxID=2899136 RepID=UPI001EE94A28|nr:helix-turn-helix domain-containing protein [Halorhodospira sp. 9622]MCG5539531.1 helix-turn-helix domain-containing protein [Halorhodospira sp. 9622]
MSDQPTNLADELIDSLGEALAHARGERSDVREHHTDFPQVRRIRAELGLSQEEFARLLGVSASGLRKWEQGQRTPRGAAATLLRIMEREPQAVARALIEDHRRTDAGNRAS